MGEVFDSLRFSQHVIHWWAVLSGNRSNVPRGTLSSSVPIWWATQFDYLINHLSFVTIWTFLHHKHPSLPGGVPSPMNEVNRLGGVVDLFLRAPLILAQINSFLFFSMLPPPRHPFVCTFGASELVPLLLSRRGVVWSSSNDTTWSAPLLSIRRVVLSHLKGKTLYL